MGTKDALTELDEAETEPQQATRELEKLDPKSSEADVARWRFVLSSSRVTWARRKFLSAFVGNR